MKEKIQILIIGILIGAILTASVFLLLNKTQKPKGIVNNSGNASMQNIDSNNLPEGFDMSNMPEGVDPSNRPEGFDSNNIPKQFDSNMQ